MDDSHRNEENHFLKIIDQIQDGIVLTDETGRIREWNQSQGRMTGLKKDEALGQPLGAVYQRISPDWVSHFQENQNFQVYIDQLLQTGSSRLLEQAWDTEIQLPGHQQRRIRVTFLPLKSQTGYQIGAVSQDLTDSQGVQQQANLQTSALEVAANGIAITDARGKIIWVNPAFTQLTGYSFSEAQGNTFQILKSGKQPASLYQDLWETILAGKVWRGELTNRRKDGSLYEEEQTITPVFDQQGQITHFIAIMQDISQRKRVEESISQMAAIVESSGDAILGVTLDGLVIHWNLSAERIYGYSAEEMKGKPVSILAAGEHQQETLEALARIRQGEQVRLPDVQRVRKDGQKIYLSLTISPIFDAEGILDGASIIARDVTARKQRELELGAVVTVANALRLAQTRAEMLPTVLDQTMNLLQARGAAMVLPDRSSGDSIVELAQGNMSNWSGVCIPKGEGISGLVMTTGKPYVNEDILSDPRLVMAELLEDPRAVACVPLIAYEEPIGVLWATRDTPFSEVELRLISAVADMSANAIHRAALHEQTEQRLQRLAALHAIDKAISSSLDLSVTLGVLLDQVIWQLGVDAADVLLLNPHTQTLDYAARRGFNSFLISHSRLNVSENTAAAHSIRSRQIIYIPNLEESKDRFSRAGLLAGEGFVSYFAVPLIAKDQVKGILDIFHRSPLNPDQEWMDFLEALAKQAAIAIDNALLFRDLQRSNDEISQAYDTTLEGWVRTLSLRDGETEDHTQRVTDMTLRLASAMNIGPVEMDYIRRGALLHDIGKMGIPDSILLKPGPLTSDEREVIRRHPVYAYELLHPITYLRPCLDIPYCHHERWDGTGYPRHLKGEEIPLAARIFAIADVWDALTSNRPYRTAWPTQKTNQYIQSQSGKHFDPQVVEAFFDAHLSEA